jgi:hypothetical protein
MRHELTVFHDFMDIYSPSSSPSNSPRRDSTEGYSSGTDRLGTYRLGTYRLGTQTPVAVKALTVYRKAWNHWCGKIPRLDLEDEKQEEEKEELSCPACGGNCGNEKEEKEKEGEEEGVPVDKSVPVVYTQTPVNTPKLEECDE